MPTSIAANLFRPPGAALAAAVIVPTWMTASATAAPSAKSAAETAAAKLFTSLTDEQRKLVAFPFNDPLRVKINPNWQISKLQAGDFNKDQQQLITEIVKGVTSPEGYEKFTKQMNDDDGGLENYAVALFGDPQSGQFEFELTGRHLTLRADGNCVPGAAFGGPLVYGHSKAGNSPENLFSYQTDRANAVFAALDGKQREKALIEMAPKESEVQIQQPGSAMPGIAGAELSGDQQALVSAAIKNILMPYRQEDVDEAMKVIEAGGGIEKLHFAFYKSGDLNDDQKWDIWRLEGPTMVCHFRGAPHVHAYINVATKA